MIVRVKRKHIQAGIRKACYGCPIALAIKDASGAQRVDVGQRIVSIDGVHGRLPLKVQQFIECFDDQRSVEPFAFVL